MSILLIADDEPSMREMLYRVFQEALYNTVKHAYASRLWVDLTLEDKTIPLTVQDNGCGFNVHSRSDGIGLTDLRERLPIAGGAFKLSYNARRSTILMAQLPLPAEARSWEAQ